MNIRCIIGHKWAYNGVLYHGIESETHCYICTRDRCGAVKLDARRKTPQFMGRTNNDETEWLEIPKSLRRGND